ncbi:MAG: hypothetical protein R3F33_04980 [Planctomycetota bacterium]
MKRSNKARRGAALISCLMLVAAVASLGAGMVQISSVSTRRQNLSIDTAQALYIAESALSEAYFAVAQGRSGQLGSEVTPAEYAGGYYWVTATEQPGAQVELKATAMYGRGKFTLGLALKRSENQVAGLGICGLVDVTIGDSAKILNVVDPINPPPSGSAPLSVRSNGDITIYSPDPMLGLPATTVEGGVHAGPDGLADLDPGVIVTGEISLSSRGITLPSFTIPKMDGSLGNYVFPTGMSSDKLMSDRYYDTMTVPAGKTLVLQGPMDLRADTFELLSGAQLIIDTTAGPVGMYTTRLTYFESGSSLVSVDKDPTRFTLFALTPVRTDRSKVIMGAKGEFYGMLIAPRSHVEVPGDMRITGSIVAETLNIGSNAQVTYPEILRGGGYGITMTPTLVAWQILEVPDSPLTRGSGTIDEKIKNLALVPVPTRTAALETDVKLTYLDTLGSIQVYTGPLTAVPWVTVRSVDKVGWFDGMIWQPDTKPTMVIDAVDDKNGIIDAVVAPLG